MIAKCALLVYKHDMPILEIPHVVQIDNSSCAQASMQGVLRYFGARDIPTQAKLRLHENGGEDTWTPTSEIAIGLHERGLAAEYVTIPDPTARQALAAEHENYIGIDRLNASFGTAGKLGLINNIVLTPDILGSLNTQGLPVICLVDYVTILMRARPLYRHPFHGHFMTVVGIDDNTVVVNDPSKTKRGANMRIDASLFFDAQTHMTDNDAVIIHGRR